MTETYDFDDLSELERQYDIALIVPDMSEYTKPFVEMGLQLKATRDDYSEHFYGDAPLQNLDYFPAKDDSPLLIFIHGGYWSQLDKDIFTTLAPVWNSAGVAVALLNYRLAPSARMADIVSDVRTAICWLWDHASDLGFDREKIVVSGHSAGGHLAALMLATNWTEIRSNMSPSPIKGGVSISGLHDLQPFMKVPFLKDVLNLSLADVRDYSPARLVPPGDVHLITCVGGDETTAYQAQNRLIALRWGDVCKADIPAPGDNHATVLMQLMNRESRLFHSVYGLLNR